MVCCRAHLQARLPKETTEGILASSDGCLLEGFITNLFIISGEADLPGSQPACCALWQVIWDPINLHFLACMTHDLSQILQPSAVSFSCGQLDIKLAIKRQILSPSGSGWLLITPLAALRADFQNSLRDMLNLGNPPEPCNASGIASIALLRPHNGRIM